MDYGNIGETIKKNKKYRVVLGVVGGLVVIVVIAGIILFSTQGDNKNDTESFHVVEPSVSDAVEEESSADDVCTDGVWVDVSGAVVNSGVYCVDFDGTVDDAIHAAGGFSGDVCTDWVERSLNRAESVELKNKVYIPNVADVECQPGDTAAGQGTGDMVVSEGKCPDGRININTASQSLLEELPGVGPSTAGKIIEGRPYAQVEDILNVKGIGESTLGKMEDQICL